MSKKVLSVILALTLCMVTSMTAFAAEIDTPADDPIVSEYLGYNSGSGYGGSFSVYLPGGASTGQATFRIYASDQNTPVWVRLKNPSGTVVWHQSQDWGTNPLYSLYPQNGAEQYSSTFSPAPAGNYTVEWVALDYVTIDCWVYNW